MGIVFYCFSLTLRHIELYLVVYREYFAEWNSYTIIILTNGIADVWDWLFDGESVFDWTKLTVVKFGTLSCGGIDRRF